MGLGCPAPCYSRPREGCASGTQPGGKPSCVGAVSPRTHAALLLPFSLPRNRRADISENVQPPKNTTKMRRRDSLEALSSLAMSVKVRADPHLSSFTCGARSRAPARCPAYPPFDPCSTNCHIPVKANSVQFSSRTTSSRPCQLRRSST